MTGSAAPGGEAIARTSELLGAHALVRKSHPEGIEVVLHAEGRSTGILKSRGLDARFSISQEEGRTFIHFESRGPNRNTEYAEGLETLLATLGSLDASLAEVLVDSRETVILDEDARRVDAGRPFPIRLSRVADFRELRRAIARSVAQTGRDEEAVGAGNPTKRIRLEVEVLGHPSIEDLAVSLSGDTSDAQRAPSPFVFQPGAPTQSAGGITRSPVAATAVERVHVELQQVLYSHLVRAHGADCVAVEQATASGRPADVVVREANGYAIYEIKTAATARDCIRQALGQLLEYAYWPGSPDVTALWIVGPGKPDDAAEKFLARLRSTFRLPVRYLQCRTGPNERQPAEETK